MPQPAQLRLLHYPDAIQVVLGVRGVCLPPKPHPCRGSLAQAAALLLCETGMPGPDAERAARAWAATLPLLVGIPNHAAP